MQSHYYFRFFYQIVIFLFSTSALGGSSWIEGNNGNVYIDSVLVAEDKEFPCIAIKIGFASNKKLLYANDVRIVKRDNKTLYVDGNHLCNNIKNIEYKADGLVVVDFEPSYDHLTSSRLTIVRGEKKDSNQNYTCKMELIYHGNWDGRWQTYKYYTKENLILPSLPIE